MLKTTIDTINLLDHGDLALHILTDIRCQTITHKQRLQQFYETITTFISAFVTAEELQLPLQADVLKRLQQILPIVEANLHQTKQQIMALNACLGNSD